MANPEEESLLKGEIFSVVEPSGVLSGCSKLHQSQHSNKSLWVGDGLELLLKRMISWSTLSGSSQRVKDPMVTFSAVEHGCVKLKAEIQAGLSLCTLTEGEVLRGAFCVGNTIVQGAG